MSFIARCSYCNHKMQAPQNAVGMSVRCPKCNNQFTVFPSDEKAPSAGEPVATAKPSRATSVAPSAALAPRALKRAPAFAAPAVVAPKTATVVPAATSPAMEVARKPIFERPGAVAGVVSLLFGGGGLALAPVHGFAFCTIPLGVVGLLSGIVGLILVLDRGVGRMSFIMPAFGAAASGGVLFVALFFPAALGPSFSQWRHSVIDDPHALQFIPLNLADAKKARLEDGGWANAATAAIQQDQMRVQVIKSAMEAVDLRPENPQFAGKKFLVVTLRLHQVGAERGLEFHHWGPHSRYPEKADPTLRDQAGKEYRQLTFDEGTIIAGQTLFAPLYAGAIVHALLVFDVPDTGAPSYKLTLPAHAWGGKGDFKFAIPSKHIRR